MKLYVTLKVEAPDCVADMALALDDAKRALLARGIVATVFAIRQDSPLGLLVAGTQVRE